MEILKSRIISEDMFLKLLEPVSDESLELMASRVSEEHLKHFGKAITLYTPLYLSNHCVNQCVYCGYNAKNKIKRHQLSLEDVENEAQTISQSGLRHILVLTGESEKDTPVSYILDAIKILKKYFDSIAIEIYPLSNEDYLKMVDAGVDSLTIYQEVYDRTRYQEVHPYGPKSHYDYRLNAAKRAADAGFFHINMGALLGLHNWQSEVYALGCHVKSLQDEYPGINFSISVPRIRPFIGQTFKSIEIKDRVLVHIILALKLFLPSVGITLSTRETAAFRDYMLPLGISKMSAGVMTSVGGHGSESEGDAQFDIADKRSVKEMVSSLKSYGYQPVLKDWVDLCIE
ncbi:MAG: 2-iminoacetate synthase ThiH [Clostridiales bacterium]|nr:2-iminoacetate synthase ThiH [Clostridiales bacterium]